MWTLGIAVALILLVVLLLPLVASTLVVRDSVARQLSAWSGYRVTLGEAPQIKVWPSFSAVLSDVTLSTGNAGAVPAVEAKRVEADLSALAALRGEIVFTRIRLIEPVIHVEERNGLLLPPASVAGSRLERAIDRARALVKDKPVQPDLSALPNDGVGAVEIENGRVVRARGGEDAEVLDELTAKLDWPAFNRAASLSATGIWHGEPVSLSISSAQPLMLLSGANAPAALALKSTPLTVTFEGTASTSGDFFVDGGLSLATPSLKRTLEWARSDMATDGTVGAFEISSHVNGSAKRLKFEKAQIKLDGNPGRGVLDVSFGQAPIGISGTLAFKTLDLQSFVSAFAQLPSRPDAADGPLKGTGDGRYDVDLRVSAATATAGAITLSEIAATAQMKGRLTAFDISDAKAFDGALQIGLRVDRKALGNTVELRIVADNIDGRAAAAKLGWRFMPEARGSVSVILKGTGPHWRHVFETADGSITAGFGKGSMPGVDLAAFLERSGRGGFFPLSEVENGSLPIDSAEFKATVAAGVAHIDKAEARSSKAVVSLGGIIPFAGRGLALSGAVSPPAPAKPDGEAAAGPRAAFFIGGSWSAPFVSPVLPGLPPG